MKKKAVFEGRIFQDISNSRNPVKLILDDKKHSIKIFEHLLAESKIVPKVLTSYAAKSWSKAQSADYILDGNSFVVARDSVLNHIKKVRITVTVEEI